VHRPEGRLGRRPGPAAVRETICSRTCDFAKAKRQDDEAELEKLEALVAAEELQFEQDMTAWNADLE